MRPKVVIVGGGFGGLYAARKLKGVPVDVTLIDRRNFHLFQPLLYQVATGGLSPADIASPIRSILKRQKNLTVLLGEVTAIDRKNKTLTVDSESLAYDFLIVATGSQTSYFGNDNWKPGAPGLKTVEDALEIRKRILFAFEAAERSDDPETIKEWLTFVVVGGGPTGVELAGSIAEIAFKIMRQDFSRIDPTNARIILVENSPRLLQTMPESLSQKAVRQLENLGVNVMLGHRMSELSVNGLIITDGVKQHEINTKTILWAAGVQASPLSRQLVDSTDQLDRTGRVPVDNYCNLPDDPHLFVIGDLALFTDQSGQPLPGLAPVAMQQGRHVAEVIKARLQNKPARQFTYTDKGNLATIGRNKAVGHFGSIKASGWIAWVLWLFIHLMYLVEFDNRVVVFFQWAWDYFTNNRGARLITPEIIPDKITRLEDIQKESVQHKN